MERIINNKFLEFIEIIKMILKMKNVLMLEDILALCCILILVIRYQKKVFFRKKKLLF